MLISKLDNKTDLDIFSGDTAIMRFNLRDSDGVLLDVRNSTKVLLNIKKDALDKDLYKEVEGVAFNPSRGYSVEFRLTSDETLELLNYNGKERKKLQTVFHVTVFEGQAFDDIGTADTVAYGGMNIYKTIAGVV